MAVCDYRSPFGWIRIEAHEAVEKIVWISEGKEMAVQDALLRKATQELDEYFAGKRKVFDLPCSLCGTPFQMAVWKKLEEIPYGEIVTYREIARSLGKEQAVRAVGNAVGKNPAVIVVPCHRVIRTDGTLGGYAYGVSIKEKLLHLEGMDL